MIRRTTRATRTDSRFPYPTLFRSLVGVRAPLVDKAGPWRDQAKLSCGGPAVALDQGHDDCGKQPEPDRQHDAGAAQGAERGNRQRNLGQVRICATRRSGKGQIGNASCREIVWKYVEIVVVTVSLK